MERLRKIIALWLLIPTLLFGAVGSWNGIAFTGWNSVVQTSWNGTGISCASSFTAQTAVFDGTNDYMRLSAQPTGIADGKVFTLALWVNFGGSDGLQQLLFAGASVGNKIFVSKESDNKIRVLARNSTATTILDIKGSTALTSASGWYSVYVCIDLTDTAKRKIYLTPVSGSTTAETLAITTYTNDTMNLALSAVSPTYTVGANSTSINITFATLAEFWFDDVYLDDTTKFISGGKPKSLGTTGQTPTGSSPGMYFSLNGSGNSWATDSSGNGNTMTVTGSLTTGTPP